MRIPRFDVFKVMTSHHWLIAYGVHENGVLCGYNAQWSRDPSLIRVQYLSENRWRDTSVTLDGLDFVFAGLDSHFNYSPSSMSMERPLRWDHPQVQEFYRRELRGTKYEVKP